MTRAPASLRQAVLSTTLMAAAGLIAHAAPAAAASRVYVVAIGNNNLPLDSVGGQDAAIQPLHYADDDAAAFFSFARGLARQAALLTVLDVESQRRYQSVSSLARAPSLAELRRIVASYRISIEADRRAGHDPVLILFYSGHGTRPEGGDASLALLDGALTQKILYDEILATLPARWVHLLIDACYAEAVVRPRDAQAQTVELSDAETASYLSRSTLARFPHVGAVLAATFRTRAHEWDEYQRGVFSHQVLSGLRGGADVNTDGRIEYSELLAFLTAANREVADPRARLDVVAHPPSLDRRQPIVDLRTLRGEAVLRGDAGKLGLFYVEDGRGIRHADVYAEPGFQMRLAVPTGGTLFVRNRSGEATLTPRAGDEIRLSTVQFAEPKTRLRGALDEAMRRGLFAAPFGPTYYRGFVDRSRDLVSVPFVTVSDSPEPLPSSPRDRSRQHAAWLATGLAVAGGVAAGVFGVLTLDARADYDRTELERPATDASNRFTRYRGLTAVTAVGALAAGTVAWLLSR